MARKMADFNGTAIDIKNVKFFSKGDRTSDYFDTTHSIKFTFWSGAVMVVEYDTNKYKRNYDYDWLMHNIT